MDEYKIILFLCNWGPHPAFQELQEQNYNIPPEVNMIRIPCTGRITKSLLFKAFEMGADGVALIGCEPGSCRYGSGTESALSNTEDTRTILSLMGLGEARLRFATFLPDEHESLSQFLSGFVEDIRAMGKTPILMQKNDDIREQTAERLSDVTSRYDVYACQDCGKCTASCPVALAGREYSPRGIVNAVITGDIESDKVQEDIWACLTCGICHERCPSDVNFPMFIRDLRAHISIDKEDGVKPAHGGFFQSMMRSMTSPELKMNRWAFLPENTETAKEGSVMFFGGCAPYFDAFFKNHSNVRTSMILSDSIKLLNFFGVKPVVLENERCCGHDLLWSGDRDRFIKLAKLNIEMIEKAGIEEVITTCPECFSTLKKDYAKYGLKPGFKVTHIYEFLETQIDKSAVKFAAFDKKITYQDSCRLNRLDEMKALPRKLIKRLDPVQFAEMKDHGNSAHCCGNSAWTGCGAFSKALQVKRLRQAHETGSDLLVTSCSKCQIHMKCAMEDTFLMEELKMDMNDLVSVIADTIEWE